MIRVFVALLLLFTLTGCSSAQELEQTEKQEKSTSNDKPSGENPIVRRDDITGATTVVWDSPFTGEYVSDVCSWVKVSEDDEVEAHVLEFLILDERKFGDFDGRLYRSRLEYRIKKKSGKDIKGEGGLLVSNFEGKESFTLLRFKLHWVPTDFRDPPSFTRDVCNMKPGDELLMRLGGDGYTPVIKIAPNKASEVVRVVKSSTKWLENKIKKVNQPSAVHQGESNQD